MRPSPNDCNDVKTIDIDILPKVQYLQDVDVLNDSRSLDGEIKRSDVYSNGNVYEFIPDFNR
jgi:hypothetical protein